MVPRRHPGTGTVGGDLWILVVLEQGIGGGADKLRRGPTQTGVDAARRQNLNRGAVILVKLASQINLIREVEDSAQRAALISQHEATLAALARLYNREHLEDPIRTIKVSECTIPLNTYAEGSSIKTRSLWEVKLE